MVNGRHLNNMAVKSVTNDDNRGDDNDSHYGIDENQ